jgi:prophage antirepressor-like protein
MIRIKKSHILMISQAEQEPAACQILGIKDSSTAMRKLSEKGVHQMQVLTKGGKQLKTFINEGNLYRLIGRSDKPQAH